VATSRPSAVSTQSSQAAAGWRLSIAVTSVADRLACLERHDDVAAVGRKAQRRWASDDHCDEAQAASQPQTGRETCAEPLASE